MDHRDRRELNKGFGDGLARAAELAFTPLVFTGIGIGLDRWLELRPLLTIVFAVWGIGGTMYMAWVRYNADMEREEALAAERRGDDRPARADIRRRGPNPFDQALAADG